MARSSRGVFPGAAEGREFASVMAVRPEVRVENEVPTQRANGKPARAGLPPVLRSRMWRYSAFIRAIIFLFAAFSLRFRRSLGFSKC